MKRIRGVIFDLDGTLLDSQYDWPAIRRHLGMDGYAGTILDFLGTLSAERAAEKRRWLEGYEERATRRAELKPGASALLDGLHVEGLRLALVTNNRQANANDVIGRFGLVFDTVVTRDDDCYKPSAEPMRRAAAGLGLVPEETAAIGDNELDLSSARAAGVGLVATVDVDDERLEPLSDLFAIDLERLAPLLLDAIRRGS